MAPTRSAAIGLRDNGTRPLGVIISHGHQDHGGLAPQLPTDIPVFIGEGAASILRAAEFWGSGVDLGEAGHLQDRVPFTLGPFTITPYLADHSAYDAFSLLIQAGGRSLFYTGDIRGHGRKASAFERLLADPPSPVNAILMVTVYRAALRADRDLVVDLYTADIAAATVRPSIPLIQHHTSGHATPADLARLVHALRPDVVVPIHTEAPDAYAATVGDIVESHADGTWWAV